MAIVNSFRFNQDQGGVISDEECWTLRLRKAQHTEHVVNLLPPDLAQRAGIVALYGGVGGPDFHFEAVHRARLTIGKQAGGAGLGPATLEEAGRILVEAFNSVTRRQVNDRLRYLYGIGLDDLNRGFVVREGEKAEIGQGAVKTRAMRIARLEEGFEDAPLSPANHACLAGWDRRGGFQGFCLKQENGVLSLQAGGFESIGAGKYAGGVSFQKLLRGMTLDQRRSGVGAGKGLLILISSIVEAGEHFGQIGGNYNLYFVDGSGPKPAVKYLHGDDARLAVEIVRAMRGGFLAERAAEDLVLRFVASGAKRNLIEDGMFESARNPRGLDLMLRGYRVGPSSGEFKANDFAPR